MVTIRYKDVSFKESLGLYCIDRDWYQAEKAKKQISDEAIFLCSLHHDELVGIVKKKARSIFMMILQNQMVILSIMMV